MEAEEDVQIFMLDQAGGLILGAIDELSPLTEGNSDAKFLFQATTSRSVGRLTRTRMPTASV